MSESEDKTTAVHIKDLVGLLDGDMLRDVADIDLKIQGWQRCDKGKLADLVVEHVKEDPLKALRFDLVLLPPELYEAYDEMIAGNAVEVSADDAFFDWYVDEFYLELEEVDVRGGKRYLCRMADEVRDAIEADPDRYERLLELHDDLADYVNCAAVLYGHVTYKEVCELYDRWNDDGLVDEQMVEIVAEDELEYESGYFIHRGCICNLENDRGEGADREVEIFLKERADKPRWYPATEDDFLDWCDDTANLESDSAKAFDEFLKSHGFQNANWRANLMLEMVALRQIGERAGKIISSVSEHCKLKTKSDGDEFLSLIGNFLDNIRLRANNGWTSAELRANQSVAAPATPVVRKQPAEGEI